jgi:hypothetical protein
VSDEFEAQLDAVFQLRPAEVVPARNALSDRLKKAGDKPAAAQVSAIKRPTPTAWAINQVHFREPELLQRASELAAKLRELHAADGVDGKQLAAAAEALRRATQQVVDAAMRHCEAAGLAGGSPQQRKVFAMVQSWLSGAADERPGRMTHDVEASGFEAIGSVGLVLPAVQLTAAGPRATTSSGAIGAPGVTSKGAGRAAANANAAAAPHKHPLTPEPDPQALAEATDRLAKREREARTAVERARERVAARKEAERELERAKLQVKDAERALVHLRAAQADREAKLAAADRELREAEDDREQSEAAVAQARTELAKLRGSKAPH